MILGDALYVSSSNPSPFNNSEIDWELDNILELNSYIYPVNYVEVEAILGTDPIGCLSPTTEAWLRF